MVLESLICAECAEKYPWMMFFYGFLYSSVAIILSFLIFGNEDVSLLVIAFTVMASSILIYNALKFEERNDLLDNNEWNLLKKHSRFLLFFVFLFLGFTFSFMFWYLVSDFLYLTLGMNTKNIFSLQINTIATINPSLSISGNAYLSSTFNNIFQNNLGVLVMSFIFSLLYGFGAVFILAWNASVLGVAMGIYFEQFLETLLLSGGILTKRHYLYALFVSMFRFFIHGIPEMAAYILSGLAGGLVSIAIVNKDSKYFKVIFRDALVIFFIALIVLLTSALLEILILSYF